MTVFLSTFSKEACILASVVLVSLISLVGIFLISMSEKKLNRFVVLMISVAIGALLGDVFIHILPESLEEQGKVRTLVMVVFGLSTFFGFEKYLQWRNLKNSCRNPNRIHPVGHMSLFADGLCNFTDGFVIGAAYLISIPLGLATTLAVIFHEIPQEIGEFGILLKAGFSKTKAILFNFVSASFAILGAVTAIVVGQSFKGVSMLIVAFTAGAYLYLVSSLIPIIKKESNVYRSATHYTAIGMGACIMLLIACVE